MKRSILALVLMLTSAALADTAADKIAAGRAALVAHDLPTARTRFQEALTLSPTSQTAGALLGITSVFDITSQSQSGTFLNDLGVSASGRNAYDWKATIPRDGKGDIVLPANYNFTQPQTLWRDVLIPESEAARANLAVVGDPSFLITLTAAETKLPMSVNVDYGDVLMTRACLRAAEFLAHLGAGQNLDANLDAISKLISGDIATLQKVLVDNPNFLTAGSASERTAAKTALLDMIALYRQASTFIRARPAGITRLFMLEPKDLAAEEDFRRTLDKAELSVTQPVQVGEKFAFAGPLFEAGWSLRAQMPVFSASGFDVTTIPDASLGGLVNGFNKEQIAAAISSSKGTLAEMGWEWVSPKPQGNSLLRYRLLPSGKHLAVGNAGTYLTSPDGSNWTVNRIPGAGQLAGLAINSGKIVSASYDGCIYASTDDAVTWKRVFRGAPSGFHSIVYGGGKYVAVGDYGLVATSVDGESWNQFYPVGFTLLDVLYTGTNYVAVGIDESNGNTTIVTSADGLTWTIRLNTNISNSALWGVAQNGSTLVAVGGNTASVGSSNKRAVSTDGGLTWTTGTVLASPTGNIGFNGVAYANGAFVAAGTGGTIATSPDGVTWTSAASGETFLNLIGVGVSGGTTFVVAGGGVILKSTNNTSFSRTITFSTAAGIGNVNLLALKSIGGLLYAAGGTGSGTTGGVILRSAVGQTFATVSSGHNDILDIIKQGSTYYAVGLNGTILTSADGASWSAQNTGFSNHIRSIAYLNGQFVITGANDMVRTSPDGTTWTARTTGLGGGQLYGAAYGNGVYVAVGGDNNSSSHVVTSPDGITWTVRNANTGNTFRGIVFYQGVFTAVGTDGQISRSNDGVNWWWASSGDIRTNILSVAVLDGRYCATLASGSNSGSYESQSAILMSSDGESWVRVVQGTPNNPNRAELFSGRLYTANTGSSILRTQALTAQAAPTVQVLTPSTAVNSVTQGSTLALAVSTTSTGITTYQWKKNGGDIVGATGPGLELADVQTDAAGNYTVVVTNAAGSVTSSPIVVTVSTTPATPAITTHPDSQTVNVGLNAMLYVEATGTTPLSYQWQKDGVNVTEGNASGANTATLTLTSLTAANGGTYTAVVSNAAGNTTSLSAVLTVDSNPAYYFGILAGAAGQAATTDGTGQGARFDNPNGVAVDSSGNVYVCSPSSYTIRKVTSAGVVTTIAGIPYAAGNGDGLIGTNAQFNTPRGVALDAAGSTLYVADMNNNRIRKIDLSTTRVTTLTSSAFSINALAVDASGNVYYTSYDQTIRMVVPAGTVTVFAGSNNSPGTANGTGTAARFNNPQGITIDAAGNLYVADSNNAMIRKITTPGAVVTTCAGQPQNYGYSDGPALSATFSNPLGIAVDAIGNIFVTDNSAQVVRKISPAQFVTTIGGQGYWSGFNASIGADARFNGPAGIAVDASGNLYLAENYNQIIRKGTPQSSPRAPIIAISPQSQSVAAGSNVTFRVAASGASTLSYQWRRNGANLSNGVSVSGATTATLSLTNVQTAAAGSYTVLVTSAQGGALSAPATLTVMVPPTVTVQPVTATVTSGQSVNLSVTATDTGYITYEWRRNGLPIPGAIYPAYSIPAALRSDAGVYDVVINGIAGQVVSSPAYVSVAPTSYPGEIAFDPSFSGSPLLTISCRIFTAIALPDGKWMVGGEFVQWDSTPRTFLARLNADYSLDTTFTPPLINGFVYALARAPDGSIYVGGEFTAVDGNVVPGLFRLNSSAALDLTWQAQDAPPNASVTALTVQADGKVLVARQSSTGGQIATTGTNVLRRLLANGTLDTTFSVDIVTFGNRLNAVVAEPAGSIAFAGSFGSVNGSSRNGLARVDSTGGTLDAVFGGAAGANNTVYSMTRMPDGTYLIGGAFNQIASTNRIRVAILNSDGSLNTFNPLTSGGLNGNVLGAARLADGRIMLAGTFSSANGTPTDGLVRLTSAGAVDTTYTAGGSTTSFSTSTASRTMYVFPQGDGSTALFGSFYAALNQRRIGLAVITAGGTLASSPAPLLYRPAYSGSAYAVPGNKTVVFGSIDLAGTTGPLGQVVRLNDDGSLDNTFPQGSGYSLNGLSTFGVYRAVRQGDGKFLAVGDLAGYNGNPGYRMIRIGADGAFDGSFNGGSGPSSVFPQILALSGGRTLLYNLSSGYIYNGQTVGAIARLNADGSRDNSFNLGGGFNNNTISAAYEQPDGKLVLAGSFTSYNGTTANGLLRLNTDASIDNTFSAGAGASSVNTIVGLPDGRLLLAGNFTTYSGAAANRVALISATGSLDGSFTAPAELNAQVAQVLAQENGKFILVGDFTGTPAPYAVRLTAAGAIDSSFALRGITGGFGSSARIFMGDDGSIYVHNYPVSFNYGVPLGFARFRGAPVAPTIATAPASVAASLGGPVTFSVRAAGTAPYTYQWQHNGVDIAGANYSALNIATVQSGDFGTYTVRVSSGAGSVTSSTATLSDTSSAPPSISSQPAPSSQTVLVGASVTYSVTATGASPLSYQWSKNSVAISGATGATLTLTNVQAADTASYTVAVTNTLGIATSGTVTLTVNTGVLHGIGDLAGGATSSGVRDATKVSGVLYAVGNGSANSTGGFGDTAVLWTSTSGLTPLPGLVTNTTGSTFITASAITPDAAYIAGRARSVTSGGARQAVRVTTNGLTNLSFSGLAGGTNNSAAIAISSDGSVLYGFANGNAQAARYTVSGPTGILIPFLNVGDDFSYPAARGCSADGTIMVGTSTNSAVDGGDFYGPGNAAFRYVQGSGVSAIPYLPGGNWNSALALSPNGNLALVRGNSSVAPNGEVYLYNATTTAKTSLGTPNGSWGVNNFGGMSADGSVVAVIFADFSSPSAPGASYIRNSSGWHDLQAVAARAGVDLSGWSALNVIGMSADATLVWGDGQHNGNAEGYVMEFAPGYLAAVTEPATFSTPSQAIVGAWSHGDTTTDGSAVVFFLANGYYIHVEDVNAADAALDGVDGYEIGQYTWNQSTGSFTCETLFDNNGGVGLSGLVGKTGVTVTISGDTATFNEPGGGVTVATRVTGINPIAGGWVLGDVSSRNFAAFAFMANNTYFMVQDGTPASGGTPGIERGIYALNSGTGGLTVTTILDTNGTWGLSSTVARTATTSSDLLTLTIATASGSTDLPRVETLTAPSFTFQPTAQSATDGSNASFTVVAAGTPAPSLQWQLSTDGGSTWLNLSNTGAYSGATTPGLQVTGVTAGMTGYRYRVVANNQIASATSNSATLTALPRDFSGTYFGTFPSGGNWALYVRADNTATYIAYLPARGSVIVVTFIVNRDGTFTATGTEILPIAGAVRGLALAGPEDPVRKAKVDAGFTLIGQIGLNGSINGQFTGLGNIAISGAVDPASGPVAGLAGLYTAAALGTNSGATYTVVGASGQAVVVTTTPASIGGATATVNTSGQLTATTSNNARLSLTIDASAETVTASVTPAGSSTPITFSGLPDDVPATGYLANLSVRAAMATGQTLIVGLVVDGGAKPMLVRAAGPVLNKYGLTGVVDPRLALYNGGTIVASNDNWEASLATTFATLGAFAFDNGSKDSALLQSIDGPHTAQATATGTGAILVEAYDAGPNDGRKLVNLSTRFQVGTGDNILIAGFVLAGTGTRQVLIRAVGPTLASYGVTGTLVDPQLSVFDGGTVLASNDNWSSTLTAIFDTVGAFHLLDGSKDAAIVLTLQAGKPYTAQASGVGNTTGEALLEIYLIP